MTLYDRKLIFIMCWLAAFLSYLAVVMQCNFTDFSVIDPGNEDEQSSSCNSPICKHWELLTNITIDDTLPVYKFKSKRTGMTVVLAPGESPIVNGYLCLATEAFNDDGLPHTLEHLIFLGR